MLNRGIIRKSDQATLPEITDLLEEENRNIGYILTYSYTLDRFLKFSCILT
jgi:hypothetical protein